MKGYRFHDLRHTAITDLAEAAAPDATLKDYSHMWMQAKRDALEMLSPGLMGCEFEGVWKGVKPNQIAADGGDHVVICVTKGPPEWASLSVTY